MAMPKYFFSIIDGIYIPDAVGLDLPDDEMAHVVAEDMAKELQEERAHGEPLKIRISREDGSKV